MGHFSNGTEGMLYEERYCSRCTFYGDDGADCPVLIAHALYNGVGVLPDSTDDQKKVKSVLDLFIPPGTPGNEKCKMFSPEVQAEMEFDDAELDR